MTRQQTDERQDQIQNEYDRIMKSAEFSRLIAIKPAGSPFSPRTNTSAMHTATSTGV